MKPVIIAEGSREVVSLFLQEDTGFDGRVDGAIDLSLMSSVEVHLRKYSDGSELVYSTGDLNAKVAIVDADGTSHVMDGKAASLVTLTLSPGDISVDDEGFDIYLSVIDSVGRPRRVPNDGFIKALILGEFS